MSRIQILAANETYENLIGIIPFGLVNVKFMINIRITYCREFDGFDSEGVLVKKISYKGKEIALIFYKDFVGKPTRTHFEDDDGDLVYEKVLVEEFVFRYVELKNKRLHIYNEKSYYRGKDEKELIKKYGESSYINSLDDMF